MGYLTDGDGLGNPPSSWEGWIGRLVDYQAMQGNAGFGGTGMLKGSVWIPFQMGEPYLVIAENSPGNPNYVFERWFPFSTIKKLALRPTVPVRTPTVF